MRASFNLPVDNDFCIHTVTFSCEGREITLACRNLTDARAIVKSAKDHQLIHMIVNKPEGRVAKVELENLPPDTEIILTFHMTLIAASTSANSILLKFPLESRSRRGTIVSLDRTNPRDFIFEDEIQTPHPIANVTSNLGCE
jgi:hypothetical protein